MADILYDGEALPLRLGKPVRINREYDMRYNDKFKILTIRISEVPPALVDIENAVTAEMGDGD
eukprot:9838-Eustigmatos_ZCMA.PRE.1